MTVCTVTLIGSVLLLPDLGAVAQTTQPSAATSVTPTADPWAAFITEASRRFGVPTRWIHAVMQAESAGEVRAVSPKGAIGLMQIMPVTYAGLRARHGLGADPYDPRDNILAGAAFLREMHDRFGAPGFLAAYNAGPGRYEEHLATGRPLPGETHAYLATLGPIMGTMQPVDTLQAAADPLAWTRAPIFVGRAEAMTSDDRLTSDKPSDRAPIARQPVDLSAIAPRSDGLFVRRADAVWR
jgi:soluble lytic murein transglycosylase-like protein